MVQAFAFQAADEALTDRIGSWRSLRGLDGLDASGLEQGCEMRAILVVSITDEILGALAPRRGLPQLLGHPVIAGSAGYRDVNDATSVQFDDDKDEDWAKQQVVDGGEVTGPDVLGVVFQESTPGLTAGGGWSELVDVFMDGTFADH